MIQTTKRLPPQDFVHLFQDRNFLRATFPSKYCTIIETDGVLGRRYTFWIFCIEYYTTDIEPVLVQWRGVRMVIWSPVTRNDVPRGWFTVKSNLSTYSFIDTRPDVYWARWNKTLRWYRNAWSTQKEYIIKKVSYSEYRELYATYANPEKIMTIFQKVTDRHFALDQDTLHFYLLEHISTKDIIASIATVDCASIHQSYYLSAFTRKDIAPPQTGLWLLAYWMEDAKIRDIWFTNFGIIWRKGDPDDWKGFSDFKMKFHPYLIIFKYQLFRFTFHFFKSKAVSSGNS